MCQLMGVNCNRPSRIDSFWTEFQDRGGRTDTHGDGWGLSFFEGKSVRLFREELSCCESSLAQWVKCGPFRSTNIIGHIRRATEGKVGLANTHPFMRELWGRNWVFAHNGTLKNFFPAHERFFPIGETDSERAFCWMMDRLAEKFPAATPHTLPSWESLWAVLLEITTEIAQYGVFNYLLSYGDFLVVRCSTHLHYTLRHVAPEDGSYPEQVATSEQGEEALPPLAPIQMALVATQPLTRCSSWLPLEPGELIVLHAGEIVHRAHGDAGDTPGASATLGQ